MDERIPTEPKAVGDLKGEIPRELLIREAALPELGAPLGGEDLRTYVALSCAFWAEGGRARRMAVDTFTAAHLLDRPPKQQFERAVRALLDRVIREGTAANSRTSLNTLGKDGKSAFHRKFFRLEPQMRFVLVALHTGRWSYVRLSRILGTSPEAIEELAWRARLELNDRAYPAGGSLATANCPAYEARRPWTQRFLDDEIPTSRERLFLQNHLMACSSCGAALARARDLYYSIEAQLPRPEWVEAVEESLRSVSRRTFVLRSPSDRSFLESLEVFSQRGDVRALLLFGAAVVVWKILSLGS